MIHYKLNEPYIELIKLLKLLKIAQTGGHAKILVEEALVRVNGKAELRKRAKLTAGDLIEIQGKVIKIEKED